MRGILLRAYTNPNFDEKTLVNQMFFTFQDKAVRTEVEYWLKNFREGHPLGPFFGYTRSKTNDVVTTIIQIESEVVEPVEDLMNQLVNALDPKINDSLFRAVQSLQPVSMALSLTEQEQVDNALLHCSVRRIMDIIQLYNKKETEDTQLPPASGTTRPAPINWTGAAVNKETVAQYLQDHPLGDTAHDIMVQSIRDGREVCVHLHAKPDLKYKKVQGFVVAVSEQHYRIEQTSVVAMDFFTMMDVMSGRTPRPDPSVWHAFSDVEDVHIL